MAQISPELRARLLGQKKAMGGGLIINNTQFTSGQFFFLPGAQGTTPGIEYLSYFCERLKKGSTSPSVFGLRCPLKELHDQLKNSGTKEERDAAYNAVKPTIEYWMAVIDKSDPGTADAPIVRILRAKKTIYTQVVSRMLDAEIGEDVTDLIEGRYAHIKKEGQGKDKTVWSCTFLDRSPVSEDQEYINKLSEIMEDYNVAGKFYAVDWDNIEEMYLELTGEKMPAEFREQEGANAGTAKSGGPSRSTATGVPAKPAAGLVKPASTLVKPGAAKPAAVTAPVKPAGVVKKGPAKAEPAPAPEETPAEDGAHVYGVGDAVSFTGPEGEVSGVITEVDEATGNLTITDTDEGTWTIDDANDLTLVTSAADADAAAQAEADAKAAAEAEEQAKAAAAAAGPKKGPAKAAGPVKAATKTTAAPAELGAAKSVPNKPASSGIKSRLAK